MCKKYHVQRILLCRLPCALDFTYTDGKIKCQDGLQCVYINKMCSGGKWLYSPDCRDESGENPEFCKGNKYPHICVIFFKSIILL